MSSSFVPPSQTPPRRDILAPLEPHERSRMNAAASGSTSGSSSASSSASTPPPAHRVSPPRGVNAPLPLVQQDLHATRPPTPPRAMPRNTPRSVPQSAVPKAQLGAWRFLSVAGLVACIATGAQLYRVTGERNLLNQALLARHTTSSTQDASSQIDLSARDRVIRSLTGPTMYVIDLRNYQANGPVGRIFWDQATGDWTMYTYTLRPPKPGSTFQLWVIGKNNHPPYSAGTFAPDATGKAEVHANYSLDPTDLTRVVVSEEPSGGSTQPSRHVILAGR